MADRNLQTVVQHVRQLVAAEQAGDVPDGELLQRFLQSRDEAAFAILVQRHAAMVLGVCRRVLRQRQDAEDACQATFLVLARAAPSIRKRTALASWLYAVAYRLARKIQIGAARRRVREARSRSTPPPSPDSEVSWREVQAVLDEELMRLPEKYRAPLLLCYLQERTRDDAASQLGLSLSTLRGRLEQGRNLLRCRLARRGVALSSALLVPALAEAAGSELASPSLVLATVKLAAGQSVGVAAARAAALAEGVVKTMTPNKVKIALGLILALTTAGAGVLVSPMPVKQPGVRPADGPGLAVKDPDGPAPVVPPVLRTDRFGDPLPPGALARLGTIRFRHKDFVSHAVFSGGKTLIAADRTGPIVFWDVTTGKELRRIEVAPGRSVGALAVAPDGKTLAAGCLENCIRLWDLPSGKLLREWKAPQMQFLLFSPDSKTLATHAYDDRIHLWDIATGEKRYELKGHRGTVAALAFSPDGKQLASGSREDKAVRLWDVAAGREVRQLTGDGRQVCAIAWSPDGKTIASSEGGTVMRFWDVATGRERARTTDDNSGAPVAIAYLPDGSALVALHSNIQTIRLYDPATGKVLRSFARALHHVSCLAVAPDGKRVAASRGGHTPELWDVATGKLLCPTEGHRHDVRCLAFTADGKTLFSGGGSVEYALRVWDPATGKELRRVGEGVNGAGALAVSPDGKLLAVPRSEFAFEGISLREPATGREVRRLKQPGGIISVNFSADGKRLASCTVPYAGEKINRTIRIWDVTTGRPGVVIDTGKHAFMGPGPAALSPDGKLVAAGAYADGSVWIWDADTGKKLRQFEAGEFSGYALAFSPDGRRLAVGGWRGAGVWDPATGKLLRRLDRGNRVDALAFAPDGRTLASGSDAVRLWEVLSQDTGQVRATLAGHAGAVSALTFSRDGRLLASGSFDTTILTWDLVGPAAQLTRPGLEALWADMAGTDAAKAYQAVRALAAAPKQALPLLRQHLRPVGAPDRARFARLLADLGSNKFPVRKRAAAELEKQGAAIEGLLRQALADRPDQEVRRRLEDLLDKLEAGSPDRLRILRAVEALEHAGGAEAKRLLEELAGGAPGAWLTREAKASLDRLGKRPEDSP